MHRGLFQIITLIKGATTKKEGIHIIMKNDSLHCLLKSQGLMNRALQHMYLLRIHTGHPALPPQLLSLDLAVLWLILRMIATDIISQHILLPSLDMFLLL
jgi:hypothetical protein